MSKKLAVKYFRRPFLSNFYATDQNNTLHVSYSSKIACFSKEVIILILKQRSVTQAHYRKYLNYL